MFAGSTPALGTRPRGAARSARHPVTVKVMGSNPIGDARQSGAVRKLAKRRSSNLRDCLWVQLPPVLLEQQHASAGHWRAHVAVTHTPLAVQVQLLPGALNTI